MFLKKLFKRGSPRPTTPSEDARIENARTAADARVRRLACREIKTPAVLVEIFRDDADPGVCETARQRLKQLLGESPADESALNALRGALADIHDPELLETAAIEARDAGLRSSAIARIDSVEVLERCVLGDAQAANRAQALERVDERPALERIAKQMAKKDKRVYRSARRKLKEINEREELPRRLRAECDELIERLSKLGRFDKWVQDRGVLELLDRRFDEIAAQLDATHAERYADLRRRFIEGYEAYRTKHAERLALEEEQQRQRTAFEALIEAAGQIGSGHDEQAIKAEIERIQSERKALHDLPEQDRKALEKRLDAVLHEVAQHAAALTEQHQRSERLRRTVDEASALDKRSQPLHHRDVARLRSERDALCLDASPDKTLVERLRPLCERLEQRLKKQRAQAEKQLAAASELIAALEQHLEAGELKPAEPLYQKVIAALSLAERSGLKTSATAKLAGDQKRLAPRLRELQKWRKYGGDQKRRELLAQMESLCEAEIPPEDLAAELHDLQMRWKELDQGGSSASKGQWNRFHDASNRVYERCKPYMEAQASEREANRQAREQLCIELEGFLDQVDWQRMDWKKAIRAERELRQAWSGLGPCDGRHRKPLDKRWRAGLKRLDKHLAEERARNQAHKKQLIEQMQALAEETDTDRAIDKAKALQEQWYTTVPARKSEENKLWKAFREGADGVFGRRRAQFEAHQAELDANRRTRADIAAALAAAAHTADSVESLRRTAREARGQWQDCSALDLPRNARGGLERAWRDALEAVDARLDALREVERWSMLDLLEQQAAVCTRIEALGTGDDALPALRTEWQALAPQADQELQHAIEARFERACTMVEGSGADASGQASSIEHNLAERAGICLQLEIIAGIESPAELRSERMQLQFDRLKARMRSGDEDPLPEADELLRNWHLAGPTPEDARLEARYQAAKTALRQASGNGAPNTAPGA